VVEAITKVYLYALVLLSLLVLVLYSVGRWVFQREVLSKRALLQEAVQLLTGAVFLPLYLFGVVGVWTALAASWLMLVAGFYAVARVSNTRPSSTNKQH
jgi:O-antigen/teichoic acid export membrane protein